MQSPPLGRRQRLLFDPRVAWWTLWLLRWRFGIAKILDGRLKDLVLSSHNQFPMLGVRRRI